MNRSEQNQAIKDLQALRDLFADDEFYNAAREVILRGRFTSGQRRHFKGELGDREGTPGPHYSDPTGDDACWPDEIPDTTGKIISAMATSLSKWRTMTGWILNLSSTDVKARAKRTMPDCLACDDQCIDRVLSGFDEKCYKRWVRAGRPDRVAFIRMVQEEKRAKAVSTNSDEVETVANKEVS